MRAPGSLARTRGAQQTSTSRYNLVTPGLAESNQSNTMFRVVCGAECECGGVSSGVVARRLRARPGPICVFLTELRRESDVLKLATRHPRVTSTPVPRPRPARGRRRAPRARRAAEEPLSELRSTLLLIYACRVQSYHDHTRGMYPPRGFPPRQRISTAPPPGPPAPCVRRPAQRLTRRLPPGRRARSPS